jgi:hypothetical protein
LFLPHRCLSDLQEGNTKPFTTKLRQINALDISAYRRNEVPVIFSDENLHFLQNIQDCAYNSMRYKIGDDALQSITEPFTNFDGCEDATNDNEDDDEVEHDDTAYKLFMEFMDSEASDVTDDNPDFFQASFQKFTFRSMRLKGTEQCGYNRNVPTPKFPDQTGTEENDFVISLENLSNSTSTSAPQYPSNIQKPGLKRIVELLFTRTENRAKTKIFKRNPDVQVPDANGSIGSILAWGAAAGLDIYQRRAFQSIVASFLLTFFDSNIEQTDSETIGPSYISKHRQAKMNLLKLKGGSEKRKEQLIMLLHGPGGAGKSTVINLVVAYAAEYCGHLNHPFTKRTIVITAMSGVAATLLNGETTHSALGLNKAKIDNDQIEAWEDTRLVFIDEASFASPSDHEKIYKNCQTLVHYAKS